jgi:hypothetical protein
LDQPAGPPSTLRPYRLALLGVRALHADPLVRAPRPDLGGVGLSDLLDARVDVLPAVRREADDLPLAGLIGEAVAELKVHREDTRLGRRPLPGPSSRDAASPSDVSGGEGIQRRAEQFLRELLARRQMHRSDLPPWELNPAAGRCLPYCVPQRVERSFSLCH